MTSAGEVIGVGVEALAAGAAGSWLMFRRLARHASVPPAPEPAIAQPERVETRIDEVTVPVAIDQVTAPAAPEPAIAQPEPVAARIDEVTVPATIDTVIVPAAAAPPRPVAVPDKHRELASVVAGFEQQLRDVDFDPEAPGMTSEARRYFWQATQAHERAAAILTSRKPDRATLLATIGEGRNALIRFGALRSGRPVPLELLSADELRSRITPQDTPQTEDRFRYEGTGEAEFLIDWPEPGRLAVLRMTKHDDAGALAVRVLEHTVDKITEHASRQVLHAGIDVMVVPLAATHVIAKESYEGGRWTIEVLSLAQASLPFVDHLTGQGSAVLRHDSAGGQAILQIRSTNNRYWRVDHYTWCKHRRAACACPEPLTRDRIVASGSYDFRDRITLPDKPGVFLVQCLDDTWSLDICEST